MNFLQRLRESLARLDIFIRPFVGIRPRGELHIILVKHGAIRHRIIIVVGLKQVPPFADPFIGADLRRRSLPVFR